MTTFLFFILPLVISEESLRYTNVSKQGYDTSCGIAVTTSLLSIYWNTPIMEQDLIKEMVVDQTQDKNTTYSISFLTMADFLIKFEVLSQGYKMDWDTLKDTLSKGFSPIVINYIQPKPHFALLLHIQEEYALVADPSRGLELVSEDTFKENYSGNALLTASRTKQRNTSRIEATIKKEEQRLMRLQYLARRYGF
jgi:predicted double-glycine peptidase